MISEKEVYEYLNKYYKFFEISKNIIPMFNILNGGAHSDNGLDIQEFMVVPLVKKSFAEKYRMGAEIFASLGKILKDKKMSTNVGNEGGYAPKVNSALNVFDYLMLAIKKAGYKPGKEVGIALDVGASELYDVNKKRYNFKLENMSLRASEVIALYKNLSKKYPIISIEDGLAEDDWENWSLLKNELGNKVMIVGDDLTTTNSLRLEKVIEEDLANAVIVKPNQIGTLSETIEFVKMAQKNDPSTCSVQACKIIVSHRSGETTDDFIADLAIAVNADFIKFGAPSRGERVCKYNRIAEILE
jgi:enolase